MLKFTNRTRLPWHLVYCLFTIGYVLIPETLLAQPAPKAPGVVRIDKKVMLVVSNQNYDDQRYKLNKPHADADSISSVFTKLGYQVISAKDVTEKELARKINEFRTQARGADIIGFFYSGHGFRLPNNSRNFLMLRDFDATSSDEAEANSVSIESILQKMNSASTNAKKLILVDACSSELTFVQKGDEGSKSDIDFTGISEVTILTATQPLNVALERDDQPNGLFTAAILKHIRKRGMEISEFMRAVKRDVDEASGGRQSPWQQGGFSNAFYLAGDPCLGNIPKFLEAPKYPTSLKAGENGFFQVRSNGNNVVINWDFGDGSAFNGANIPHIYTKEGTYQVTVTASNTCGEDQTSFPITVLPPPNPCENKAPNITRLDVLANAPTVNENVRFESEATGTDLDYLWDFGDGKQEQGRILWHSFTQAGTYIGKLVVSNQCGKTEKPFSVVIKPPTDPCLNNNPAILQFEVPSTGTTADILRFAAKGTGTGLEYEWDFGDGLSDQSVNPVHSYTKPGKYTVKLTIKNQCSEATQSKSIQITPPIDPCKDNELRINRLLIPESISEGVPVTLGASVTGRDYLSLWDFDDNTPKERSAAPTHTFAKAGRYKLTLAVTNTCGGVDTQSRIIEVKPNPCRDKKTVVGDLALPATAEEGQTIKLAITTPQPDLTYSWQFGDGKTAQSPQVEHRYERAGRYTVRVTANGTCGADTQQRTIEVKPHPCAQNKPEVWGLKPSSIIITGQPATFSVQSKGKDLKITWDFGDGTTAEGLNPSHTYQKEGEYTIKVVAENDCGVSEAASLSLKAKMPPSVVVKPEVKTPPPSPKTLPTKKGLGMTAKLGSGGVLAAVLTYAVVKLTGGQPNNTPTIALPPPPPTN